MPFLFIYLLKLSISLAVVYLFYRFVLRRLTFYNWNRWYLAGYSLLCFAIAMIDIGPLLAQHDWNSNSIVEWVPSIQNVSTSSTANVIAHAHGSYDYWQLFRIIFLTGAAFIFMRVLIQLFSLRRIARKAALLSENGTKIFQVNEPIIPFSFGNAIFINRDLHSESELEEIIRHEFVHVKQHHTIDILWAELLCMLNWYNPFAWLLRSAIRQNLEFVADNKVLVNGVDKKQYQYLLLKVIGNNHFSIASQFNFSSLKKRIAMMNKLKSARHNLVRFLFVLPFVAVLLLAFRGKGPAAPTSHLFRSSNFFAPKTKAANPLDTIPRHVKLPPEIASIEVMGNDDKNGSEIVENKMPGTVTVKRKDGKKEVYDLGSEESLASFEKKYGVRLEDIVPPPPPPKVAPPPPPPPAPPAKAKDGSFSTISDQFRTISDEYEISDKQATLKLKDGTIEKYDLTNAKQKAAFEKKYGKLIAVEAKTVTGVAPVAAVKDGVGRASIATVTPIATTITADVITPVAISTNIRATTVTPVAISSPVIATTTIAPVTAVSVGTGTTVIAPMAAVEGVTIVDDYGYTITGKEDILVTITKKTTRQQLDDFIRQMKEKDIVLDYDDIKYNGKGELISISGTMKSKDGHSNFVATDFRRLVLAMIRKEDGRVYFKVSVSDDKDVI